MAGATASRAGYFLSTQNREGMAAMLKTVQSAIVGAAIAITLASVHPAKATTYTPVDISSAYNVDLSTFTDGASYNAYLGTGTVNIAGVNFQVGQFGNGVGAVFHGGPETTTFDVDLPNINSVFTIFNSAAGAFGSNIGQIKFIDSNSNEYAFDLVEGDNIRDHYYGSFNNVAANIIGSTNNDPGHAHFDAQQFTLPSLVTLKQIQFIGNGGPGGSPFLAALSVAATVAATPIPPAFLLFATALGGFSLFARSRVHGPKTA